MPEDWTAEKIERVRRFVHERGLDYASVGLRFGVSRSAIAGLCDRNNIQKKPRLAPSEISQLQSFSRRK